MADIQVSDLRPVELEFEELSDMELEAVVGGKSKTKIDVDGDGDWDYKHKES